MDALTTLLPYAIGTTIVLSWTLSLVTFVLWRRMVHRDVSLLATSLGMFSLSLSFASQLLLVVGQTNPVTVFLNPTALIVALSLFLWSTFRLAAPKRRLTRLLPWLSGAYGFLLFLVDIPLIDNLRLTIGVFAWLYVLPVCATLGSLYVFGYSQSVLVDTFRKSRAALFMSLAWFLLGLTYTSIYWVFDRPGMTGFYLALSLALALYLVGLVLVVRRSRPLDGHREVHEDYTVDVEGEEWQVKFL